PAAPGLEPEQPATASTATKHGPSLQTPVARFVMALGHEHGPDLLTFLLLLGSHGDSGSMALTIALAVRALASGAVLREPHVRLAEVRQRAVGVREQGVRDVLRVEPR